MAIGRTRQDFVELLQCVDEAGNRQDVTSTDVNEYLKEITARTSAPGRERVLPCPTVAASVVLSRNSLLQRSFLEALMITPSQRGNEICK
jgi:hypothetical protein